MSEFYVGQKVVCVDARPNPNANGYGDESLPNTTDVYTIRDLLIINGDLKLRLNEIVNLVRRYAKVGLIEPCFSAQRFRPLEEKPDAIEWARQICRDVEAGKTTRQKIVAGLREAVEFAKRGVA